MLHHQGRQFLNGLLTTAIILIVAHSSTFSPQQEGYSGCQKALFELMEQVDMDSDDIALAPLTSLQGAPLRYAGDTILGQYANARAHLTDILETAVHGS